MDLLRGMPSLRCLYLKGNPVVSAIKNYRKAVIAVGGRGGGGGGCAWVRRGEGGGACLVLRSRASLWRRPLRDSGLLLAPWGACKLCPAPFPPAHAWLCCAGRVQALPQLTYLDDRPVFEDERRCCEAW
jgi:hypothetical protein